MWPCVMGTGKARRRTRERLAGVRRWVVDGVSQSVSCSHAVQDQTLQMHACSAPPMHKLLPVLTTLLIRPLVSVSLPHTHAHPTCPCP